MIWNFVRDLSQQIRDQLKIAFAKGEATNQLDREQCDRYYMSLKRISGNYHGQIYKRTLLSTASGLNREQCNFTLTSDMLEYLQKGEKGIFEKLFDKFKSIVKK